MQLHTYVFDINWGYIVHQALLNRKNETHQKKYQIMNWWLKIFIKSFSIKIWLNNMPKFKKNRTTPQTKLPFALKPIRISFTREINNKMFTKLACLVHRLSTSKNFSQAFLSFTYLLLLITSTINSNSKPPQIE